MNTQPPSVTKKSILMYVPSSAPIRPASSSIRPRQAGASLIFVLVEVRVHPVGDRLPVRGVEAPTPSRMAGRSLEQLHGRHLVAEGVALRLEWEGVALVRSG